MSYSACRAVPSRADMERDVTNNLSVGPLLGWAWLGLPGHTATTLYSGLLA